MSEGITVIMPVYNQQAFITRALESLQAQSFTQWELIIINDASTDNVEQVISSFLADDRVRYIVNERNRDIGTCFNMGIERACHSLIAYLPADDIYYRQHLEQLYNRLAGDPHAVLAFSGVRYHYNRESAGIIDDEFLQPVQVLHRKTGDRWMERSELVTDDHNRMFWNALKAKGSFVQTGTVSCEWVEHPLQRHKLIREPKGGINTYRSYYHVKEPLRFQSSAGNLFDEAEKYRHFRERPDTPPAADGLKILLVGDLGYVPDRILALEERGNRLFGLWLQKPYWYTHVGPVPFGHIEDVPYNTWKEEVERIKPDVIYALLDWQSVPVAHEVLVNNPGIPFVWNLKEGPFICLRNGTWDMLVDLYKRSDGQIYPNTETMQWYLSFIPTLGEETALVLDGDLPKKDWFIDERVEKISSRDGDLHTVVPGRPIGLHPHLVAELAKQHIHLHVYGDIIYDQWRTWTEKVNALAPGYLHVHPNIDVRDWTKEFSKYDAGWLHFFESNNHGELRRMTWDDLNYPARFASYAFSGLPMIQRDNTEHIVAMQTLAKEMDIGIFIKDISELGEKLRDEKEMKRLGDNIWQQRWYFTFDHHAERLLDFFRKIIGRKK